MLLLVALFLYMPYSTVTFGEAKQRLAQYLGDPGKVFFVDHELGRYIIEALRWWNLESMYFRETGRLEEGPGGFFNSVLNIENTNGSDLLQPADVTDRQVINDINYSIMEPQISNWAGSWIGTEMFSLDEIASLLGETNNEFIRLTGCIASQFNVSLSETGASRIELSEFQSRILRVSVTEFPTLINSLPLYPVDQVQLQSTTRSPIIPERGRPKAYAVSYSPQLTLDVWPPPDRRYVLEIFAVDALAPFTPQSFADFLFIPDDATVVIKYGVLEKLLSGDGLQRAPRMAEYCAMRYTDGLDAMSRYQSLLWAEIGGRRKPITSVEQLDQTRPTWAQVSGFPRSVAQLNWERFVLSPQPDTDVDIIFEMVRTAIIPTQDSDFIQVGSEHIQAIYDYAQHVALFKCQGAEFESSLSLYQSAKAQANEYRSQVASQSYLYRETQLPSYQSRWFRPYRKIGSVEADRETRKEAEV